MNKNETPRWETAVLLVSFVLIWIWFLARQQAYRTNDELSLLWNVALGVAVIALVAIFVRRLKRVLVALRGQHPAGGGDRSRN